MAKRLKNMAIVTKITITKFGTDSAVIKGINMTTHGIKPDRHPTLKDNQYLQMYD